MTARHFWEYFIFMDFRGINFNDPKRLHAIIVLINSLVN